MSASFQRGMILLRQNRPDLADREFRQGLVEDPDNALAHAFLSLCLSESKRKDEALREADEAIRLDPGLAFGHYVRGRVYLDLDKSKEAEAAVREAIALDPAEADYYSLLAGIALGRRRWAEALGAAEEGLALDPEHAGCTNLRAMALVQLGRKQEAADALGSALADDPENALTHANQGWALLHRGDHAKALEHFREALRIDPELEWAQAGIVEALKARHLVYRLMLRFFLWMGRQSTRAQWIVILGFVFGRKILADIADSNPRLAPLVTPVLMLSTAFLLMTWISSPLFNLLLRLNRFGRLALSRDQRIASTWIGACFAPAVICLAAHLVFPTLRTLYLTMYFGFLLVPLAVTFRQPPGTSRSRMAAYTGVVALLGLPVISMLVLDTASPWRDGRLGLELFRYFVYGAVLSTWIHALVGVRTSVE